MTISQGRPSVAASSFGAAPPALIQVWRWELRRWRANPFTWAAAGAIFLLFLAMVWFKHAWSLPAPGEKTYLIVVGTTGVGLILEAVNVLLLLLGLIVPFAVTDGVARDQKERLHEVLMASALPTSAYVWGRFLATACVGVSLAVLVLLADYGMGRWLATLHPEVPTPSLENNLIVWAIVILPATVFLTGVGFTLGTLWPHRSTVVRLGMLVGWLALFIFGNELFGVLNHAYRYLDPTSTGILSIVYPAFLGAAGDALAKVPPEQQAAVVAALQVNRPDLTAWVLPHAALAAFGVALVSLAATGFKRFRNALS
jgi:ABC-type transport system involved in multi-copper enzyme maturation permease subunit